METKKTSTASTMWKNTPAPVKRILGVVSGILALVGAIFLSIRVGLVYIMSHDLFFGGIIAAVVTAAIVTVLSVLLVYFLAQYNLFWTIGKEGTYKQVLYWGKLVKTFLFKRGYKTAKESDEDRGIDIGDAIPIEGGDVEPKSGLRWVGIWPFSRVYSRRLAWKKAHPSNRGVTDRVEYREEENVDFTLAKDYVYAIEISMAEVKDQIPFYIALAVKAWIVNADKANFGVQDWYEAFVSVIMDVVQRVLRGKDLEKIEGEEEKINLAKDLWRALEDEGKIASLRKAHGVEVRDLVVMSIDPGNPYNENDPYRGLTLKKTTGRVNAEQAIEETAGRIFVSVAKTSGITVDELKKKLARKPKLKGIREAKGGFKEAFAHARDLVNRDRAAMGGVTEFRAGNPDGTPFSGILSEAVTGLAAWSMAKAGQIKSGGSGGSRSSKKGGKKNDENDDDDDDEFLDEIEDEINRGEWDNPSGS